ncbi:heme NO-binding domain-containing protein [Pelagibius sp.]|uniref:heme NO-binding domain-containing protein n=1 Tax=Pelagibius sp. TaxID=1931238 RepID=UPI0026190CF5|nr:heme NO-binding domain-containing protein [Pelagibius sp.]
MKGILFTEFLEMVDQKFSPELTERIIDQVDVPSGCAYTTIGTYDHTELVQLVVQLSKETDTPVTDLVRAYGFYLFERFVRTYPRFFSGIKDAFTFLEGVESIVHAEVRKLYTDSKPPMITATRQGDDKLEVIYESQRCLGDAAHGLILGCVDYFGEKMSVERQDIDDSGSSVRFLLTRAS